MTIHELINTDIKKLVQRLDNDRELALAFNGLIERIGFSLESGRSDWLEIDHDFNCPHHKVTIH